MSTTNFIRLFFLLAIIILCCAALTGQIKIKERVEISPGKIASSLENTETENFIMKPLNPYDFAIDAGGFVEYYDNIYQDLIFIPRIGGVIGLAYDDAYLHNVTFYPWSNRLYVFGPLGDAIQVFHFDNDSWFEEDGEYIIKWNKYAFSQEKYEQDRKNAYSWAERDSSHLLTDSTRWGLYPKDRMFLTVKPWEPIRFRYFYLLDIDPDEGVFASPFNNPTYNLFTDYPNSFGIGAGRLLFPSLVDSTVGQVFPMRWIS